MSFLSTEERKKTEEIKLEKTDELKKGLEKKLFDLKKVNQELEEKTAPLKKIEKNIARQEKELENLKNNCLEKAGDYDKEKLQEKLEKLLKAQKDGGSYASEHKEKIKSKLLEKTLLSAETLNNLCQKQAEITKLKLELEKKFSQQEEQIDQIVGRVNPQELIKLLIRKELKEENIEKIAFCNT